MIYERHGITNAMRLNVSKPAFSNVMVDDSDKGIDVGIQREYGTAWCRMTPEQARFIARRLYASARRFERAQAE